MLVLSRKVGQKIVIDERVTVTITRVSGGRVSIGIEAPPGVHVRRSELEPLGDNNGAPMPTEVKPEAKPNIVIPGGFDQPTTNGGTSVMSSQPV